MVKDSQVVQNVISSAERASQWAQSDAREVGQFVVCSDCVTVSLDFTRVDQLPPPLVLDEGGQSVVIGHFFNVPINILILIKTHKRF